MSRRMSQTLQKTAAIVAFLVMVSPQDGVSESLGDAIDSSSSTFDFSGIEEFWKIYECLATDKEPTSDDWDKLFSTPGYDALNKREKRRAILTRGFRLAYMPSKKAEYDSVIAGTGWLSYVLPHLRKALPLRDKLNAFKKTLSSAVVMEQAVRKVQTLLPADLTGSHPPPRVAVIIFAPDGRGYPEIIVADLLRLMQHRNLENFFAHELFHFYVRRIFRAYRDVAREDRSLMDVLINSMEEGIADQLDKSDIPDLTAEELKRIMPDSAYRSFYEQYRTHFLESPQWLGKLEGILEDVALGRRVGSEDHKIVLGNIPFSGRPLGAYVARAIVRTFGREKLISVAGDALGFWLTYADAANRVGDRAPSISANAVAGIEKLRRLYEINQ